MPVRLDHTIVHARDKQRSAGLRAAGLEYWADLFHQRPGRINTDDGGRGLYWSEPDRHSLEIITRPYGG